MNDSRVFTPLKLENIILPNRLIRSATFEGMGDNNGVPSAGLADLYKTLALNDVGTIITGFCYISVDGKAMHPGQCGIDSDGKIKPWKRIVDEVKKSNPDTILIMQIAHSGRQTLERVTGTRPVSASATRSPYFRERAIEMDGEAISKVVNSFAEAARRARESGFDGVQLHAAHGYLIHQFMSPAMNRRKDHWGRDSCAFPEVVLRAIKDACGVDFPVFIKVSGRDDGSDGLRPEMVGDCLRRLEDPGLEAAEISYGTMDLAFNIFRGTIPIDRVFDHNPFFKDYPAIVKRGWKKFVFPGMKKKFIPFSEAYNLKLAEEIRNRTEIPLVLVGGLRRLESIETILRLGVCDAVSMCRPLICEPDLVRRFKNGEASASQCTNCNTCAVMCDSGEPLQCYTRRS